MANQITDNRTLITNADSTTNWVWSTSAQLDTDVKIQGTGSIGEQMTSSRRWVMYDMTSTQDWSNNVFYIWVNCGIVGLLDTKALGGFTIRFAGPNAADFFEFYVGGSDSWPTAIAGGWVQFVVDIEAAPSNTGGTPPATSAVQHVGYSAVTATVMTKVSDNTWIDEIRRLPDGSPGIIIEGRDGGATDWDFSDILTQLTVAAGTIKEGPGGSYVINTPIQFGINDTSTHGFSDTNKVVFWDDQEFAPADLYKLSALGNSGGTTNLTLGIKTGTGDDATGAQGVIFAAASTGVRWAMDFDDPDVDGVNFYGCSFIHGGDFQLDDPAVSVISSQYLDCTSATVSNSQQLRASVISANTEDGVAFMTTDDLSDIVFCDFQFSDGHGVMLTTPLVTPQTSKGNLFTGYGGTPGSNLVPDSGSTDAAVYNNAGGAITINITSDGSTPSVRNGANATTTVVSAVDLTVKVVDKVNLPIENAQTAIYTTIDDVERMNKDTDVNGDATESYSGGTPAGIYIRVRKSSTGDTRYIPNSTTGSIESKGFSTTITLLVDPNA